MYLMLQDFSFFEKHASATPCGHIKTIFEYTPSTRAFRARIVESVYSNMVFILSGKKGGVGREPK